MSKTLLTTGAVFNVLFGIFHVWLGWTIEQSPALPPETRGLVLALNVAGTLMIFFLAYASAFCAHDLLATQLGRAVLVAAAVLYLSRAVVEYALFTFSAVIFFSCLLVGVIYAALLWEWARGTGRQSGLGEPDGHLLKT
jgi:hypothetical protein